MKNLAANGMTASRKLIAAFSFLVFICALFYSSLYFATDHSVQHQLNKLPQNTLAYINYRQELNLNAEDQKKLSDQFLINYFASWDTQSTPKSLREIKNDITYQLKKFQADPGVGANTHPYSLNWIKNIENNVDLAKFPNSNQNAITVRDANIRILPTTDPSFMDLDSISRGYPFDNLQQTFIPAGTPIHIIQTSKDKAWYLVSACSYSGWIKGDRIAFVSTQFEKEWQTGSYAVSIQDNIPIFDNKRRLTTKTRIGVLYPIKKSTQKEFSILTPAENPASDAVTKSVKVSRSFLTKFPVPISTTNIAAVANNFIGKPYGWGGIYGYRDCSSTLKDLFATFGIWLPRHSAAQVQVGTLYSLRGLGDKEKERKILEQGIPFLTLIHLPRHVVLYIGHRNGHPIVFQNMWGLHIYKLFGEKDRVVIGKTVITPINFGKNFINSSQNILREADSMTLLVKPNKMTYEATTKERINFLPH